MVSFNGTLREVTVLPEVSNNGGLKKGDWVKLSNEGNCILGKMDQAYHRGEVCSFERWFNNEEGIIALARNDEKIYGDIPTGLKEDLKLEIDQGRKPQLLYDHSNNLFFAIVAEQEEKEIHEFMIDFDDVTDDMVGGLWQQRTTLENKVIFPFIHRDKYAHKNIDLSLNCVFSGPTGVGKSYLAKWLATALARKSPHLEGKALLSFSGIRSMWYGETERKIMALTNTANELVKKGYFVIVYLDEADTFLGSEKYMYTSSAERSTRACLQSCISGLSNNEGVIWIATTNHPEDLAIPALRAGRFGIQVHFPKMDLHLAKSVFKVNLKKVFEGHSSELTEELSEMAVSYLYSQNKDAEIGSLQMRRGEKKPIYLKDLYFLNAALITQICKELHDNALKAELNDRKYSQAKEDLIRVIDSQFESYLKIDAINKSNVHDHLDLKEDPDNDILAVTIFPRKTKQHKYLRLN